MNKCTVTVWNELRIVQSMPFFPIKIQSLVYGLWDFSHSASLEGCFAIQMLDGREAAERKWKNGNTDGEQSVATDVKLIEKQYFAQKYAYVWYVSFMHIQLTVRSYNYLLNNRVLPVTWFAFLQPDPTPLGWPVSPALITNSIPYYLHYILCGWKMRNCATTMM